MRISNFVPKAGGRTILIFLLPVITSLSTIVYSQQDMQGLYKVPAVYLPELKRPAITLNIEAMRKTGMGYLPTYDGEPFHVNFKDRKPITEFNEAKSQILSFFRLVGLNVDSNSIKPVTKPVMNNGLQEDKRMNELFKQYQDSFQDMLKRKLGKLSSKTTEEIRKTYEDMTKQANEKSTVFGFTQQYQGITIENVHLVYVSRDNGLHTISGNVFTQMKVGNKERLDKRQAYEAAVKYVTEYAKLEGTLDTTGFVKVLVPYIDAFKYAWKFTILAEDGPYKVWIDAENGNVLQLLPEFFYDNAQGLRLNPSPYYPAILESFEVNSPSGGNYSLVLSGVLQVINNGADGCTGNVTVPGGSGMADFNVAPINSLTNVQTQSGTGYNCRFQEVNAFATIYWLRYVYKIYGSQTFPLIICNVNRTGNSNSFNTINTLNFSIGNATMGNTTSVCPVVDKYSGAIDATCIAHEFGHFLNKIQFEAPTTPPTTRSMTGSINEGLADFWACTMYNTDTMGAWYGQLCPPTQTGYLPRLAEANDVFPEHRYIGSNKEIHADGQMICWAMWNVRREYQEAGALGILITNINLMKALTTAGAPITDGITDRRVHDSYVDLESQLVSNSGTSWFTEKMLSGFARAGLFLSDREAIIDIDDDYLNRNSATPPTFTVWTGRDYTFDGSGNAVTTGTLPYNVRYKIDVANDPLFTMNFFSSGVQTNVTAGAGGTATWQLTAAMWNTLKAGDKLYYKVQTTDNAGGNERNSNTTGDMTVQDISWPYAVINESGVCECSCSVQGSTLSYNDRIRSLGTLASVLVFGIPVVYVLYRRHRIRKKGE